MNARTDTFAMAMTAAAALPAPAPAPALQARARRAALLLHTVSADDRDWLLAQLSTDERRLMEPLLTELRELDIPIDRELLADAAGGDAGEVGGLAGADPALVARVLAAEPLDLIARVFALGPWPWSGAVLAALSPVRREQLRDRLTSAKRPAGPRSLLDARLLELVEARVQQSAQEAVSQPRRMTAQPHPGQGVAIVPGWMRRWLARDGALRPAGALE